MNMFEFLLKRNHDALNFFSIIVGINSINQFIQGFYIQTRTQNSRYVNYDFVTITHCFQGKFLFLFDMCVVLLFQNIHDTIAVCPCPCLIRRSRLDSYVM